VGEIGVTAVPTTTVEGVAVNVRPEQTLLTPAEVATMFRVDPKTVTRWARAGKLKSIKTLGGHRRYLESEVRALLDVRVPVQRRPGL